MRTIVPAVVVALALAAGSTAQAVRVKSQAGAVLTLTAGLQLSGDVRREPAPHRRTATPSELRDLLASTRVFKELYFGTARANGEQNPQMKIGRFAVSRTDPRFAAVHIEPNFSNGADLILRKSDGFWGVVDFLCCGAASCDAAATAIYTDLVGDSIFTACPNGGRALHRADAIARVAGQTPVLHRPARFTLGTAEFRDLAWRGWGQGVASAPGHFCVSSGCVPVILFFAGLHRSDKTAPKYESMVWRFGPNRPAGWRSRFYAIYFFVPGARIVSSR